MRWICSGPMIASGAEDWILGFYIKFATSPDIKQVCEDQCRSREQADGLLGLLYWESDRMRPDRPVDDPVFGELMGRQIARAQGRKRKEEQKEARADLRRLDAVDTAIGQLSIPSAEAELRAIVEKYRSQARSALAPPLPGPTAISINGQVFAPDPPSDATSISIGCGRPAFDHASENTYLELVRRLVKKAYKTAPGPGELEKAVAIVQHFSPGLLPNQYDANQLGSRLKAFTSKPGVGTYLKRLEADFVTRTPFTVVLSPHAPRPLQS